MNKTVKIKLNLPRIDSKNEDERISAILIPEQPFDEDESDYVELPEASLEMLTRYHNFLMDKLPAGLKMMGREDVGYFACEENLSWAYCDDKEFEVLKEKEEIASVNDQFEFIRIASFSKELGLIAEVKRIFDKKIFQIPLVDLEVCKRKTKEHQLVDDYSSWFVNFGPESM
jgi:hypothetical protein